MGKPMKNFGIIQAVLSTLAMPCGFLVWGMAAIPGIWMFHEAGVAYDGWHQLAAQGAAIGMGLLVWCILDLFILGIFGLILRPKSVSAQAPTQSWFDHSLGFHVPLPSTGNPFFAVDGSILHW